MTNQQLLEYIKQQSEQGVSKEEIRNTLMASGWQSYDIEKGFAAIKEGSLKLRSFAFLLDIFIFASIFWVSLFLEPYFDISSYIIRFIFGNIETTSPYFLWEYYGPEIIFWSYILILWIIYFIFMGLYKDATLGKRIIGVKTLSISKSKSILILEAALSITAILLFFIIAIIAIGGGGH